VSVAFNLQGAESKLSKAMPSATHHESVLSTAVFALSVSATRSLHHFVFIQSSSHLVNAA